MNFFPIFLRTEGRRIVLAGGGDAAIAKLRLLMKTEARIDVFAEAPDPLIESWAAAGRLALHTRRIRETDLSGAALVYGAEEDDVRDIWLISRARVAGIPCNIVDDLGASDFLTPALVDRDPVVVAIGTEGTAPVLARKIKAEVEATLPTDLGSRARQAAAFRSEAEVLPKGRVRREFWGRVFHDAFRSRPAEGDPEASLRALLSDALTETREAGRVLFAGAGPGDPEDLTLRVRRALDTADVVIHDRLVPQPILELVRREALVIEAGKTGFGPSMRQADIDALIVEHAQAGALVVRLKSGDPTVFGRLDEEIEACEAADIDWQVLPGITAASAAVATIGQSLTKRGRNTGARLLTGHDAEGLADHDWTALARPGEVTALYMGKRAARFVQGRLLMHGAAPETPVSVVENAGRPEERVLETTLARLEPDLSEAGLTGPALILLGLAPRRAAASAPTRRLEVAL